MTATEATNLVSGDRLDRLLAQQTVIDRQRSALGNGSQQTDGMVAVHKTVGHARVGMRESAGREKKRKMKKEKKEKERKKNKRKKGG
jgi:hypothetical protein